MLDTPNISADVYTDNKGLAELKRSARADSPEAIRAVARQFEALFLQTLLKDARAASLGDGIFDNEQTAMYQDLFDKQISLQLSEGRGMGLADMLERQLLQMNQVKPAMQESDADPVMRGMNIDEASVTIQGAPRAALPSAHELLSATEQPLTFDSPQDFVEKLWPMARETADKLGVDAKVLLAQAALETGWGRNVNRGGDGRSSHNLFNIKADERWDGERVSVNTLEYRDGVARKERANFRAYDSYADSFADYAKFLQDSPRYQKALSVAHDAQGYTNALQEAGYATDPQYSAKIMRITQDLARGDAAASVKLS